MLRMTNDCLGEKNAEKSLHPVYFVLCLVLKHCDAYRFKKELAVSVKAVMYGLVAIYMF